MRLIFKIFLIIFFISLFFGCATTTNNWVLSDKDSWKEFLKIFDFKYKCLFIKGYFDFYSEEESFRTVVYSKISKKGNLFLQLSSPIGSPLFILQKNEKEISFYNAKENILYIAKPCYNLLNYYFNINCPFDLTLFLLLVKREFSKVFIDYSPSAQYEYSQKIKFIFHKKIIKTIIWDKKSQKVEILGEYKNNRWRVILKNFDLKMTIYNNLFLKYKDIEIKIKILKGKFLNKCNFLSLKSMFLDKAKIIYLKEGACGKKRRDIFRSF